jgi:hypothetical protein
VPFVLTLLFHYKIYFTITKPIDSKLETGVDYHYRVVSASPQTGPVEALDG